MARQKRNRVRTAALLAASLCLFAPSAHADGFQPNAAMQAAKDALQHGNGKLALKLFADESKRGDGYADLAIGEIYFQGMGGVARDYDRAAMWFVRAWQRGGDAKALAAERLERVGEATGHSAKEVRGLLALGELARLLPKGAAANTATGGDPDPLGDYFGRKVFNDMTGHAFENPLDPGGMFGD